MKETLINIQHDETGRLQEWPVNKPIPYGWAKVSDTFVAACGDCDPCLGGRPDQCALKGNPMTSPDVMSTKEAIVKPDALNDESKAAIVATKQNLEDMLIALEGAVWNGREVQRRCKDLAAGIRQLLSEAFPPNNHEQRRIDEMKAAHQNT